MNQENVRRDRKIRKGVVISNKMNKTVIVKVTRSGSHKKYGKIVLRSSKCYAHDESGKLREGDEVEIMETRPLSKLKRWRVVSGTQQRV